MRTQVGAVATLPEAEAQATPLEERRAAEEVSPEFDELDTQVNYDSMEAAARVQLTCRVNWTSAALSASSHAEILSPQYELAPDETP